MVKSANCKYTKTHVNKPQGYKTALAVPDLQIPWHDEKSLSAVLAYARDCWWDYCVILGDFLDFDQISRWNENTPRKYFGRKIVEDFAIANEVLDCLEDAVRLHNRDCEIIFISGNHEQRLEGWIDKFPQFEGLFDVQNGLRFQERRIKYWPGWETTKPYKIGKAHFLHGRFTNKYHAAKMVDYFGVNIYYGHVHDVQVYAKVQMGDNKTIEAASLGCLCRYDQPYIQKAPTNWQHSFSIFKFMPDGYFQRETINLFKHRFIGPETGLIYDGTKL